MFGNIANSTTVIFPSKSASDSAAGTSTWKLVTNYEGAMLITQTVGTVTAGSIAGAIYTATDDSGAGSAAVTGATFTSVTTATDESAQTIVVQCNSCGPYISYVPVITTGPAVVSVTAIGTPKYV